MASYSVFGRVAQPIPKLQFERPKVRDKELNSKWATFARSFLRRHPFCAECGRRGRDVPAQLVNHIIPRRHGGSLWSASNIEPACHHCHNGVIRSLEHLAIEMGDVHLLATWMEKPESKVTGRRPMKRRSAGEHSRSAIPNGRAPGA
jgi:hypothetical protein